MMQFTNPIWLWALTGLAIPVGIHLLSRREGKVIAIGSLKHLRESPTAQFKHIRLNEIVLLALRCLLLTLFVMLLAGVTIDSRSRASKRWLIIEKGIEQLPAAAPFIDSLRERGFELRSLAHGFPLLSDSSSADAGHDYWALAEALNDKALDSAVVISFNYQKNFKGGRVRLPLNVLWLTHDPQPADFIASAISTGTDSIWARTAYSSSSVTQFKTQKTASATWGDRKAPVARDTVRVAIFADRDFSYDQKIIMATLQAIQSITPNTIITTSNSVDKWNDPDVEWVLWLSDDAFPGKQKKNSIAYRQCSEGLPVLVRVTPLLQCRNVGGSEWVITQRLNEVTALTGNFATALADIILPFETDRMEHYDRRAQADVLNWSSQIDATTRRANVETDDSTHLYVIFLFLIVLAAERWLAFTRNQ